MSEDDALQLEGRLRRDLAELADRWADERFAAEAYRALAARAWHPVAPEGSEHVTLSFARAEALVNELRAQAGAGALALAQTGGEGQLARTVETELVALGWRSTAAETGEQDPEHLAAPPHPPGAGAS